MSNADKDIIWFDAPESNKIALVGGKNASLGEMTQSLLKKGINVPTGFATSTEMFNDFVEHNNLRPLIEKNLTALESQKISLSEAGQAIRNAFEQAQWPEQSRLSILASYQQFNALTGIENTSVAVRSSATAEDLPDASFAGQQASFLNISGGESVLKACQQCFASLFTDRAISYRSIHKFNHLAVALSVGVQQMVRSDTGSSGVTFTLDTETGFDKVVNVSAIWGLGENIVQGIVDPDEFCVYKPLLEDESLLPIIDKRLGSKAQKMIYGTTPEQPTCNLATSKEEQAAFAINDQEVLTLARWACLIEKHYQCPMDIEWAKDGENGQLYIVQARPETVQSLSQNKTLKSYHIQSKNECLLSGLAIGQSIVAAPVCIIHDIKEADQFVDGSVLVTQTTDPDWLPLMKRAAAIVTNHGGRTSHAAIVSRELGLPAVLGTENATETLEHQQLITVSCAEGDLGFIYQGEAIFSVEELDLSQLKKTKTKIMLNLANPATAFQWWLLNADGIGLVRMEFVINNHVKVHPMALLRFSTLANENEKSQIEKLTSQYPAKAEYFVDTLALGLARFAALVHPRPCIIRMSDFKTNEYAHLLGGRSFEPEEENPMLGFRGASRYYSPEYKEAFALECQAIKKIREEMGFKNVIVMIPFCRTIEEAGKVIDVMEENGLSRGQNELEIYMMCEIPSNVILAQEFAELFDGFSIGSNDLTQLTLGIDRDSTQLASLFDERNEAVKWMIDKVISASHEKNTKVGLCGQAPSDHPEFADFLVKCGIDSISVSPDSFFTVRTRVALAEEN